ncbi:MAG: radical SAM protein [Anaerolineae bacterium]|nr:radical SAM protein [Anaerolineae bacterium]
MMGPLEKLRMLSEATQYEPAEDVSLTGDPLPKAHAPEELIGCISHAATPKGRVPLLKTLVSSACERNCNYCAFRSGRNFQRASFTPEELAYLFLQIYEAGLVKGIFLSSGMIGGGPKTQDRILETAAILRQHHRFTGYLHLKIMPGAERDQIAAGMALADRVSLNLEAPNARRLTTLAPKKGFDDELLTRLTWVHELRQSMRPHTSPSMTTQFVVGAAGESDVELLLTTEQLTRRLGLARAYFSIFSPVPDTPLEMLPPASLTRQRRLYQASFLLRDYGFAAEELPFAQDGNLPLETDPK